MVCADRLSMETGRGVHVLVPQQHTGLYHNSLKRMGESSSGELKQSLLERDAARVAICRAKVFLAMQGVYMQLM